MAWAHTTRLPILIWCLWAFPFTIWDTLYLLLRPHSLPGQKWHDSYFSHVFAIWASVDHIYGEEGWRNKSGFVLAQSAINVTEATLYMVYIWIILRSGSQISASKWRIGGRTGAWAVLVGEVAGCVTATKTAMYFMRECFSGFKYTGHNDWRPFLVTWGGMNLLYISTSMYMIWTFSNDILNGLERASMANSRESQPSKYKKGG
ncbi:uncharacterized protein BDR25DRAFT_305769 [Lindgomyces ingoldianus]|uniref:Uncharacterized protein n=1 Tax=Lindgomyces ingoldianus TaxID=673940 RepID=A0ACB6QJ35_9PLEO|nr:uncharacterized protein BDR25DRAFT_305769 [Lindgomyces ingoldianus]KAF2466905.1 hypothetical protein BDR25DRAFT_305769 [Lindgomyces ingoldianus]